MAPPPNRGQITATAALVRGLVTLSPKGNELTDLSMEGQVELVEQPAAPAGAGATPERAVEIRGDQLQLSRPTAFDARAVVSGRPATVIGRGLDLEGPLVEFDRGRNRVTVDGAGLRARASSTCPALRSDRALHTLRALASPHTDLIRSFPLMINGGVR